MVDLRQIEDMLIRLKEVDRICKNMLILKDYRNFIGVELDEKYFNIAKERIEKHKE